MIDDTRDVADEPEETSGTLLVLEDDPLTRYAVSDALKDAGYAVLEAATSQEAVGILKRQSVDLLFADVHLPCEGEGFLAALYARARHPQVKVILTSGQSRDGDQCAAERIGRFVPKPYLIKRVVEMVRTNLETAG